MKNLTEYLNEQLNEKVMDDYLFIDYSELGDELLLIYDVEGRQMEFDTKKVEQLMKKCHGYGNEEFIKAVFDLYPEADQLSIELCRNNDENEQRVFALRDEIKDGWQDA